MLCCTVANAHDFEVDGIYYNILSEEDKTVEVTCRGSSYGSYSDEYSGDITIPANVIYNGASYSVTTIGSSAFYNCSSLANITIPNSVTTIGNSAFTGCTSLASITIPNSVTTIGNNAFYNCSSLASITIPNSVTTIGNSAFYKCSSLASITIPNSVTTIGSNAFYNCSSLASISVATGNTTYDSRDNCNAIIETATNTLISGCQNTVIPSSVTTIGDYAFGGRNSLTSIEIPNSVTTIGSWAFYSCSSLANINIPNSITTIEKYAFGYCSSLTSINIPNSVTTIGNSAFASCSSLASISVATGNTTYDSRDNCNAIIETATNTLISGCQNTVIPNSVTTIGDFAFAGRSSLTSIEIPNSVTTVGLSAFASCSSLASITTPNCVTTIGSNAFWGCSSLASITIGNSVTTIGSSAFYNCSKLKTIINLSNLTFSKGDYDYGNIARYADKVINAPNGFIDGDYVWGNKDNIYTLAVYLGNATELTLPADCNGSSYVIGEEAFYNCNSLTSITIPNSVTTIGKYAFCECSNLASITSLITADKLFAIDSYVFEEKVKNNSTLYVPAGAKATYAATSGWNEFKNIVELPSTETFDLTVSAANYATLYLDYNARIPAGVEVYTASTVDGNRLMMEQVTDILPANTGVIVRAEQGSYTFEQSFEETEAIENNLLRGSVEDEYITPEKGARYYVLAMKDGVVGMYKDALSGGTFKNNAHKAYLVLKANIGIYDEEVDTEDPGVQLSNSYYFDFSGTTAIDPVVTEVNDNIYYDLSGRRVDNPTQGIYIVNGKKVLVK